MRLAIVAALLVMCADAHAAEPATIVVRPSDEIGAVNRLVFGNNMLAYQGRNDEYGNRGAGIWDPEVRAPVAEYADLARQAGTTAARWPGGCAAHNYNWKNTVGPLEERPDQQFGLPEFVAWCEAVDAVPIITIAVYWGTPQDGADLVEYLNAPNDGSNPGGGTDWAAVRAADGHPDPCGVIWFEYGNESYHGEHEPTEGRDHKRVYSGEQYARLFLEYRSAMRAVDTDIKLGAVLLHSREDWNRPVLEIAGDAIDFGILHTYLPGFHGDTEPENYRRLMEACVAFPPAAERRYDEMNALVEEVTGRADVPWAITEYNGHFVGQREAPPFRQSLCNALRNAEHLRVMLQPRHGIAMANFWQFANEYWGMVRGYVHEGQEPVKQANYYVYQLYAQHFGDTLIAADVRCGAWDFAGGGWVGARSGEPAEFYLSEEDLLHEDYRWQVVDNPMVEQSVDGPTLTVEFEGPDTNYYHASVTLPAEPSTGYRVTGEIRTQALATSRGAGLQVGDARGWTATRSAEKVGSVRGDTDWTPVTVNYVTLADADAITIMARRLGHDGGDDPVSGIAQYRLVSVQRFQPSSAGAVPDVSVNAAKREERRPGEAPGLRAVTLMIVNTNLDDDIATTIAVEGLAGGSAQAWSLVGPEPWSHNSGSEVQVRLVETEVHPDDEGWALTLPRHSLTAVEIRP